MEMRAEILINAPAGDAWEVIGERFGDISEWASAITESAMDGLPRAGRVRTCHVAGSGPAAPGVIKERIVVFDPEAGPIPGLCRELAGRDTGWPDHAAARNS